jgi:glutamate synthase (NADPH/NADH) large chain
MEKPDQEDVARLKLLIQRHRECTDSRRAGEILDNWDSTLPRFVKVVSLEYKNLVSQLIRETSDLPPQQAVAV